MRPWLLTAAALAFAPAPTVCAQTIEITPVAGLRFGGGNVNTNAEGRFEPGTGFELDDTASFGVHVGYRIGDGEIEVLYARQNTRLQSAALFAGVPFFDLALETWQLGGNVLFGEDDDARVRPFVGIGIGLTRMLPEPEGLSDETRFSFSLGGGAKLRLGSRIGLRLEARWLVTVLDGEGGGFRGPGERTTYFWTSQAISQADLRAGLILRF